MSPEPVTAERVYRALKEGILLGRRAPGSPINLNAVAAELDLSVSPVRDALHRLIGERIVAVRAGGGFQLPLITISDASELYAWHGRLTSSVGGDWCDGRDIGAVADELSEADESDPVAMADVTASFFNWLAEGSGNGEHEQAILSAGERLHPLRLREVGLSDRKEELAAMVRQVRHRQITGLRRAIISYHRCRISHALALVDLLFSPSFVLPE